MAVEKNDLLRRRLQPSDQIGVVHSGFVPAKTVAGRLTLGYGPASRVVKMIDLGGEPAGGKRDVPWHGALRPSLAALSFNQKALTEATPAPLGLSMALHEESAIDPRFGDF